MRLRNSAFTLIELLVVLAIMGVLAAVLVPVLTAARRKAQQVTCGSNLRQIHIGFTLYLQDHVTRLPHEDTKIRKVDEHGNCWFFAIDPYLIQRTSEDSAGKTASRLAEIKQCPLFIGQISTSVRTYKMNHLIDGLDDRYEHDDSLPAGTLHKDSKPFPRLTSVRFPERTVLVLEASEKNSTYKAGFRDHDRDRQFDPYNRGVIDRHSGGANYLFVNGAVEWLKLKKDSSGDQIAPALDGGTGRKRGLTQPLASDDALVWSAAPLRASGNWPDY